VPLFLPNGAVRVFLEQIFKVVEIMAAGTWRIPVDVTSTFHGSIFLNKKNILWLYCTCPYNINNFEPPSGTIQQMKYNNGIPGRKLVNPIDPNGNAC
jgi:hypothetical protein